ncbi:4-hydroxy-tetrahydrodipicolinate synthase [Rhodoligotrophos defluvii]|uniref:4-hydroxy-tetrahydrodipicolinate synthase n=1 Tax=Rhodoligotrophos defluvii TaxID=2561934 RepID=UPI0010C988DB|nr:4-hydroxy-tetrahydrodipicolinate synthase [Rhodoligotrophos defluvii]
MFKGSITALITPLRDGAVDEKAFQDFVDWQIKEGTHGVVPVGTTGESPTLDHNEHERVIALAVEAAAGRVPVIAGTGSNSTDEAISLTRFAQEAKADAALVVVPYYNKPTQEGLYQHFRAVASAVDIPILVYNVPGRTVANISVETLARLARDVPNVVGVKDATSDVTRATRQRIEIGTDFIQLSGEDASTLGFMAHGGHGAISVTANVAPRLCAEFQEACMAGDFIKARSLHDRLMPLHIALFVETSPAPVKFAASLLGRATPELRLPLVAPTETTRRQVEDAMRHAGLIN